MGGTCCRVLVVSSVRASLRPNVCLHGAVNDLLKEDVGWPRSQLPGTYNKHLAAVSRGRAAGPDGIPTELIVAGGLPAVGLVSQVFGCLIEHARAPAQWRGGRLAVLWKKKGDSAICSNSRGILIGDHCGKLWSALLASHVSCRVDSFLPQEQCGCMRGRNLTNISPDQSLPFQMQSGQLAFCCWSSARPWTRSCVKHCLARAGVKSTSKLACLGLAWLGPKVSTWLHTMTNLVGFSVKWECLM